MLEEGPCPECGAADWETVKADWSERVRGWLRTGMRRGPESFETRCRQCGFGIGEDVLYEDVLYEEMRPQWWGAPARLIATLLDHRSMIPAPYIYFVSLAIGVLFGIGLDAWLGWPWWLVALGFLVLVWLAFLSSAFFGPGRRPPLREELLDAVHPGTRSERMRQRHERMIRSCPFPLYGLDPSWTGPRFIGGSSDDGRTLAALQLGFGDHFSMGRWLRIETSTFEEGSLFDLRHWAIELWRRAGRPPPDLPSHQWSAWVKRRIDQHLARGANWSTVTIPVDAAPVRFDWLADGADWVARATIAGVIVTIEGHLFPVESVRLERVTDVEPYIEGSRRYEDEQRRQQEE